jgi:hypothetical protein
VKNPAAIIVLTLELREITWNAEIDLLFPLIAGSVWGRPLPDRMI